MVHFAHACCAALQVNWNKGTALEHLLGMLGLKGEQDVTTIYIGDDQTDEDAFRVLKETGQGKADAAACRLTATGQCRREASSSVL